MTGRISPPIQDPKRVYTIAEYKNKQYRYTMSEYAVEIERITVKLDMLLKSGCKLYYCGDIDPEGIEIADKVLARGAEQIFLWRMTEEDYYRSLSDEKLTENRLKKLDKIVNIQLRQLSEFLKRERKAGYQEHLIDLMVRDIKTVK